MLLAYSKMVLFDDLLKGSLIDDEALLEALADAGAPADEVALPFAALTDADEAFLVSTGRHVQPIRRVDDCTLSACPGPLTRHAARVWHDAYDDVLDP